MKILFLSSWFPFPQDNGSKIRIFNLLSSLAQYHDVTVLSFYDPIEPIDIGKIEQICRITKVIPWQEYNPGSWKALAGFFCNSPRSVIDTFNKIMDEAVGNELQSTKYNCIVATQIRTAPYVRNPGIPCVLDELELGVIHDKWDKSSSFLARLRTRMTWSKTRHYYARLIKDFSAVTVVSRNEQNILGQINPGFSKIVLIPNGTDISNFSVENVISDPHLLIYNGALSYSANYDAMRFFLAECWPIVRTLYPQVKLKITGRTGGVNFSGLALDEHVTITGYQEDIRSLVKSARVCIVPLRIGGGTRLKILEAMAVGTPVVSTSKGAEGLEVTPGQNILVADTPEDFAWQTVQLLTDSELWHRISVNGRQLVEEKYDWRIIGKKFVELVESVVWEKSECLIVSSGIK